MTTAQVAKLSYPLLRGAAAVAYRGGTQARLPILMYHRVLAEPDPLQPGMIHAALADRQFEVLSNLFQVMPLQEAADLLEQGRLPARALCITFDDGYRDNHDVALPLLKRHGLTATFFIATGFIGGGRMFHDTVIESVRRLPSGPIDLAPWGLTEPTTVSDDASRVVAWQKIAQGIKYLDFDRRLAACEVLAARADAALPDDLMMTPEQVAALARAGMSIGGHTANHPILEKVDDALALHEIRSNRDTLTAIVGAPPLTFAYPNGKPRHDYSVRHVAMVRESGYQTAVSTAYGVCSRESDRLQLPRFVVTEASYPAIFLRLMRIASCVGKDAST